MKTVLPTTTLKDDDSDVLKVPNRRNCWGETGRLSSKGQSGEKADDAGRNARKWGDGTEAIEALACARQPA